MHINFCRKQQTRPDGLRSLVYRPAERRVNKGSRSIITPGARNSALAGISNLKYLGLCQLGKAIAVHLLQCIQMVNKTSQTNYGICILPRRLHSAPS